MIHHMLYVKMKGAIFMASAVVINLNQTKEEVNAAMNVLFSKLDEAIDDIENGRVQTVDEAWEEIDNI